MTRSKKVIHLSFDTETTGFLKYEGDKVFSFSTTTEDGLTRVVRLYQQRSIEYSRLLGKRIKSAHEELQELLLKPNVIFVIHNAKFDLCFLKANGFNVPENIQFHDTMIMSQLLNNVAPSHALDNLAEYHYDYTKDQDEALKAHKTKYKKKFNKDCKEGKHSGRLYQSGYHAIPIPEMHDYQVADGERGMLLFQLFWPKIQEDHSLLSDYLNELDHIRACMRMEDFGMLFDDRQAKKLLKELSKKLDTAKTKALTYTKNKEINFNSTKQVADLIYNEIRTKKGKKIKCVDFTEKKEQSVGKEVLQRHREKNTHPIFDLILQIRSYEKGLSNIESYTYDAHPVTRRLHPNINTNHAATGRKSITNPPLQTISKETSIGTTYGTPARRCFRADPGHVLFAVDYSGIELRLIINAANELELIKVINEGGDVHDTVSEVLYGENWHIINELIQSPNGITIPEWIKDIPENDYGSDFKKLRYIMRAGSKYFSFGQAYGGGYNAVTSGLIGLNKKQIRHGFKSFEKRWPGVFNFTKDSTAFAKEHGYVVTAFGRKLRVRRGKHYTGANYTIQGTGAGILKRAVNRLDRYFMEEWNDIIRLIIDVHDETIFQYPRILLPKTDIILPEVANLMTTFDEIKVKLDVEFDMSTSNWAAAKAFKL